MKNNCIGIKYIEIGNSEILKLAFVDINYTLHLKIMFTKVFDSSEEKSLTIKK